MGSRAPAILAVDDNPDALAVLRLLLRGEGFEVIAASGSGALQFMQQHFLPDLVITDYAMPAMTGLDLCNHLRSQPETRHIPIFLHSALSEPPAASPHDEVFTKPADLRSLVRTKWTAPTVATLHARQATIGTASPTVRIGLPEITEKTE